MSGLGMAAVVLALCLGMATLVWAAAQTERAPPPRPACAEQGA